MLGVFTPSFTVAQSSSEAQLAVRIQELEDMVRSLTGQVEANDESLEGLFAGLRESAREMEASLGNAVDEEHETSLFPASSAEPAREMIVPSVVQAEPSVVRRESPPAQAAIGGQQLRLL